MPTGAVTEPVMTGKKLFAYIIVDEITTDMELVHRAESGHGESLSFLGGLYYDKKQYKKAIGWYTLAAFRVHQFSLVRLAHMYHTGRGVAKPDYATAFELYSKASMNGNATATNNVGCMYAKGHGVTQSIASALKWYKAAANMGSSNAQFNLGFHHEKGTAGQVNIDLALYFYEKSAAGGTKKAEKAIKRLNKKGHQLFTRQKFFDLEKHLAHQVMIIDDYEKKLANFRDQLRESEEQKQQLQRNIDVMAQQYALLRMNVNCQT